MKRLWKFPVAIAALFAFALFAHAGSLDSPGVNEANDPVTWTGDHTFDGLIDFGTAETFTDSDATPDVSSGSFFNTNTTGVTITDFDGTPTDGQLLIVRSAGAIVYDCTGAGLDCGSADITMADGDVTEWIYDGTDWDLVAFMDVSTSIGAGVAGPASSTDNAIVRFDGTGGMILQDSNALIDDTGNLTLDNAAGPALQNEAASSTNPTLVPDKTDSDTGAGHAGPDQFSFIAGQIEGFRLSEASSHILITRELHAGITAGTTQTQAGGFQLLSSLNEIATVATADDTVVMPEAVAGRPVEVINNGANNLQIFPAVGDDIGEGVDAPAILEPNEAITYLAYDAVNWFRIAKTQRIHGSAFDESNTDAFGVAVADQVISYHTNGLAGADELGWTFDIGGGGTSFAIASVADGVASGVDIEVTTTGSHNLENGAIVSHTDLADAAYRGVFVVKAIISVTEYEVAAVFTATDTGTMDEAATLTAAAGSAGEHELAWSMSATSATNNETFDFQWYRNAVAIPGSSVRRKFGTGGDFGSLSGVIPPFAVAGGDKISLVVTNTDSAGDITVRNLSVTIDRV